MASASTLTTSALTGPSTMVQISLSRSLKLRPSFATKDGLLVTPSKTPQLAASLISLILPVSKKSIMAHFQVRSYIFGEACRTDHWSQGIERDTDTDALQKAPYR